MKTVNKQRVATYTMKLRLYPSPAQKETLDKMLHALHIAYNMTFHEVFLKNPMVCSKPEENGAVWPDYRKMAHKEWRKKLIEMNPAVAAAPAASLQTKNGIFLLDGKRAWVNGMKNIPVDPERRKDFRFYNERKPRRSFYVQVEAKQFTFSPDNERVLRIHVPKVGRVKARGFNRKLWFGEEGRHTFERALAEGLLPQDCNLSVRVSRDPCGDYFLSITFIERKDLPLYLEISSQEHREPVGIDAGIKDVAVLSTGQKVANLRFKSKKQPALDRLARRLSRRWGPANMAFRDYNKHIRSVNKALPEPEREPPAQPSGRYRKTQLIKARIERRAARQRETYYHQQTAAIIQRSSYIAREDLRVANMKRNHKLAYALSDAAMSDFLSKLEYKAERAHIECKSIGQYEPSSQLCSACGALYPETKNLSVREWICPRCGATHDRDINAAKNILSIALAGGTADIPPPEEPAEDRRPPPQPGRRRRGLLVFPDDPTITIVFSKELTRFRDPRYVVINSQTKEILDDAQGAGYRSAANARNCYKARIKRAKMAG